MIVAAAVLHDIGKLRELDYHPVEARYTTESVNLIGHVLMGRDLVRETARKIDGFPEPRPACSFWSTRSSPTTARGSSAPPIMPQTLEALLVSFVDDLDAKMNAAACGRLNCSTEGAFTDKVWPLENRRFYKGIPASAPCDDDVLDLG